MHTPDAEVLEGITPAAGRSFVNIVVPLPGKVESLDAELISHDDDVVRTIVDLPEEHIKALDTYRKQHRISRAEAVRRAVAAFIPPKSHKKIDFRRHPAFGSSKTFRKDDSVELVRWLRDEWA